MKKLTLGLFSLLFLFNLASAQPYYQNGDYNPNPIADSCVILYKNFGLRSNDSSTNFEVSKLQNFLQDKGLLNSDPTGYFGRLTENAVKSYQLTNSITQTGYVGSVTRGKIQSETCNSYPVTPIYSQENHLPKTCTMEAKMCPDGSYVGRTGPNCEFTACPNSATNNICVPNVINSWSFWTPEKKCNCPEGTTFLNTSNPKLADQYQFICQSNNNLQDYSIDMSIYSSNLNKYLTKNSNGFYDATDVDGVTKFSITTSNSLANCRTQNQTFPLDFNGLNPPTFFVSDQKYFSQNYDKNSTGLDYYYVTCGDNIKVKKIQKQFTVETKSPVTNNNINICPLGNDFYDANYPNCNCPSQYIKQSAGYTTQGMSYCSNVNNPVAYKPVIYLYPTSTTMVSVKLDYNGKFIATYPTYDNGWKVLAHNDGKIINTIDNREYSYLFWEGIPKEKINYDMSTGFVIKGSDTIAFLQQKLESFGLTPKEYNEFIVFWYPKMKDNKYNLIHFANTKEYDDNAKLTITPKPDSILRVFMVTKPIEKEISIKPQHITPFERKGFTVVEWGGTEIK